MLISSDEFIDRCLSRGMPKTFFTTAAHIVTEEIQERGLPPVHNGKHYFAMDRNSNVFSIYGDDAYIQNRQDLIFGDMFEIVRRFSH